MAGAWYILTTGLLTASTLFTVPAKCKVENLTISQHAVFMTHGTIRLLCSFDDTKPQPDYTFIWHHNDNTEPLVTEGPNYGGTQAFSYELTISNANTNNAGRYSCNVHGSEDTESPTISTTIMEVSVDEDPVIGEIGLDLELDLLRSPNTTVRCFLDKTQEALACKMKLKLSETDVGNHNVVIVSKDALWHYKTLANAIGNQVTFNMSKPLIGLKALWDDDHVQFVLMGNTTHISKMNLVCSHAPASQPYAVRKDFTTNTTFTCKRNETWVDMDVRIQWKDKILFDKNVTEPEDNSGSRNYQATLILVVFSVMSTWLLA